MVSASQILRFNVNNSHAFIIIPRFGALVGQNKSCKGWLCDCDGFSHFTRSEKEKKTSNQQMNS